MRLLVVISTLPTRREGFVQVMRSLARQNFNSSYYLHVYWDGSLFGEGRVLDSLRSREVTVTEEAVPGGPSGTLLRLKAINYYPDIDVVAFMDDDIIYPRDYLTTGIRALYAAGKGVVTVSFHGKVWKSRRFSAIRYYPFDRCCKGFVAVHAPGVGVSFSRAEFVRSLLDRGDLSKFRFACDILFGVAASEEKARTVVAPHEGAWLRVFGNYKDAVCKRRRRLQQQAFDYAVGRGWLGELKVA